MRESDSCKLKDLGSYFECDERKLRILSLLKTKQDCLEYMYLHTSITSR